MSKKSSTFADAKVRTFMSTLHDIDNPYIPGFEEYIRQGEPGKKERALKIYAAVI